VSTPSIGEVVGIVVGILSIIGALTAGVVFVVKQVLTVAGLRADLVRLTDAINRLQACHERGEEEMREHKRESHATHTDIYRQIRERKGG
jgi:hypothetical protein